MVAFWVYKRKYEIALTHRWTKPLTNQSNVSHLQRMHGPIGLDYLYKNVLYLTHMHPQTLFLSPLKFCATVDIHETYVPSLIMESGLGPLWLRNMD